MDELGSNSDRRENLGFGKIGIECLEALYTYESIY
jgi:endonuclease IV